MSESQPSPTSEALGEYGSLLFLVAIAVFVSGSCDWRQDRLTAYPAECSEATDLGICGGHLERPLAWERYRVSFEQQRVASLSNGSDGGGVSALDNCVVFDRANWRCYSGNETLNVHHTVTDGKVRHWIGADFELPFPPRKAYVSYWRWWQLKTRDWLR